MPDTLAQYTGVLLFRAIGRKIIKKNVRQREDLPNSSKENVQFNSCDSCTSEDYFDSACSKKEDDSGYDSNGQNSNDGSCYGTSSSEDGKEKRSKSWKSLNVLSLASALQNLKLHVTKHKAQSKKKPSKEPKSILRRPVRHVYVRGISGLPTRRVPVNMYYYRQPRPGARFYS